MIRKAIFLFLIIFLLTGNAFSDTVYDLWDVSEDVWEVRERDERYEKLTIGYRTARNQTFMGRFKTGYDLYRKWGYEFYELNPYYESYAFRNWENYSVMNNRRRKWSYDDFGDRIIKMGGAHMYRMERYNPDGTWTNSRYNQYLTTGLNEVNSTGVTIATETTRDYAAKLVFAGEMALDLTPMTMKLSMIPTARFDFWSPNNLNLRNDRSTEPHPCSEDCVPFDTHKK